MPELAFISAFVATAGSIIGLTKIAIHQPDVPKPKSVSEVAVLEDRLLVAFRGVLVTFSSLFTVSIYWFITPRLHNGIPVVITWTFVYVSILIAAILPARGKTFRPHVAAAQCMGVGMLALAYIFWRSLNGGYADMELTIAITMSVLAVLTYVDMKRYIVHELAFIFLNHVTIVIAALALVRIL